MSSNENSRYGIKLAIVYAIVWFVDLLDSTSLNVSVTAIANSFGILASDAEGIIAGFFLAMTIGISISGWLGDHYGMRRVFLFSQILYISSSILCGLSPNLPLLVLSRTLQGFAGGLAIPLGMAGLLNALPRELWAKATANINVVTLLAPALGPLFGVYAADYFGWRSIFFLKLPISFAALILSAVWVRSEPIKPKGKFDWSGFIVGSSALLGLLFVFSETGKGNSSTFLALCLCASLLLVYIFIQIEKRKASPLMPVEIFTIRRFSLGNLIQSTANVIFLGGSFIIALYLQQGIGLDLVEAGWVMACISPGMILAQPLIGRYYNRFGGLPFMLTGLTLLSSCMLAFLLTSSATPIYMLAVLVFLIGAASSLAQSSNVIGIFASLTDKYKGTGSSLYSLIKQLSASFGVALSAMVFSLSEGSSESLFAYHCCFAVLAGFPVVGLFCCYFIRDRKPDQAIVRTLTKAFSRQTS